VIKKSQNSRNQGFSYYFCLVIEGSGAGTVPLTNGSGSRRPKNIRILRIRIHRLQAGDKDPKVKTSIGSERILNYCYVALCVYHPMVAGGGGRGGGIVELDYFLCTGGAYYVPYSCLLISNKFCGGERPEQSEQVPLCNCCSTPSVWALKPPSCRSSA
jgi:hypothetical protein